MSHISIRYTTKIKNGVHAPKYVLSTYLLCQACARVYRKEECVVHSNRTCISSSNSIH